MVHRPCDLIDLPEAITEERAALARFEPNGETSILRLVAVRDFTDEEVDPCGFNSTEFQYPDIYDSQNVEKDNNRTCVSLRRRVIRQRSRRRRARNLETLVLMAAAFLAIGVAVIGGARSLIQSQPVRNAAAIWVTVAPGDTLWSIARRYTQPGDATADTISAIRAKNPSLNDSRTLSVGQRIVVPAG